MPEMKFLSPIDGDVLFSVADGVEKEDGLHAVVKLSAPVGRKITIGGAEAAEENGEYTAEVLLDAYRNTVEAVDTESGEMISMVIYWFRKGYKTYRLGVDDVIWCFRNIWRHQDTYQSIFEDPFLRVFKDLHEAYGTYVHMHVFYETVEGDFNLSMFPDKYKPEFQANSDWLKFSFHSRVEHPGSPYKYAPYDLVMREGKQVEKEILRFAGPEVMNHVTSQHFADSNLHATRAFRNLGFKCIDAYFQIRNGEPWVSYYLDVPGTLHAADRDFWFDNAEDILFVKDDIVINEVPLAKIDDYMENISAAQNHCFHYLLIHEQYFYEDYRAYEPDYKERIFRTVDWCHKHGYRPATITEIAFEPDIGK